MSSIDRRAAHQSEILPAEAAGPLVVDLDLAMANLVSCASVQKAINNMRTIGNLGVGTVTENGEALPREGLYRRITDLGTQHALAVHREGLQHDSSCEEAGLLQGIGGAMNRLSDAVMASAPGWNGV